MTELYSKDNLFTAFNNIEKIKKEKQERKVNKVIRVEEMIRTIKEHYNLNAPMLAHNLGVDVQAIYRWEKGGRPNIKRYNKIKELYEGITKEEKKEVLEQPEIANKEVIEDITVGTPFIKVTLLNDDFHERNKPYYVSYYDISGILENECNGSMIYFLENEEIEVIESPAEVLELIRKTIKENEKN
jgi:hypothetical protein